MLAVLDTAAAREDRRPQLLLTQQEALQLTEQAQNQGLQGTGIKFCNLAAGQSQGVKAPGWLRDFSNKAEAHQHLDSYMRVLY